MIGFFYLDTWISLDDAKFWSLLKAFLPFSTAPCVYLTLDCEEDQQLRDMWHRSWCLVLLGIGPEDFILENLITLITPRWQVKTQSGFTDRCFGRSVVLSAIRWSKSLSLHSAFVLLFLHSTNLRWCREPFFIRESLSWSRSKCSTAPYSDPAFSVIGDLLGD